MCNFAVSDAEPLAFSVQVKDTALFHRDDTFIPPPSSYLLKYVTMKNLTVFLPIPLATFPGV